MNLQAIKTIAQAEMGNKRTRPFMERGNKYTHGERVAVLAVRLRQLILPNEAGSDDILTVAAWFHDVCHEQEHHAERGAQRTRELLADQCPADTLERICGIIAVHDDRKPEHNYSGIIKIQQDADHLDHFGVFDIWGFVANSIGHDESVSDALRYLQTEWPDSNARWRSELHFDLSRRIYDEKTAYMKSFIERFSVESVGAIWREDALWNNLR